MERSNREFGTIFKKCVRRLADHKDKKVGTIDEELAERFGYTRQTIGHWKTGYSVPEPDIIETLAKIFISAGENDRQLLNRFLLRGLYGSSQEVTEFLDEQLGIKRGVIPDSVYHKFKPTIDHATADFVGRENIFNEMDEFIQKESCGYMIIEGHPGMGKTAIMARYFQKKNCVVYFNIRDQRDSPNDFLESIQEQLIHRYAISPPAEPDKPAEKLNKLFLAASSSLKPSEKLIILIDALDEANHSPDPGGNLLHLPRDLPQRVYIIMTKRPERLPLPSPKADIDLSDETHQEASKKDVERYIRHHLAGKNRQVYLDWMARQDDLTEEGFVQTLVEKSENNFMYLYHVMHEIGKEKSVYQNVKIEQLPKGLQKYYETHWDLMAMTRTKIYIVYTICEAGIATADMITEYVQPHDETIDIYDVEEVLQSWINFLHHWLWDGKCCYQIYHESFRDFLRHNRQVMSVKKIIGEVNRSIGRVRLEKLKRLMQ